MKLEDYALGPVGVEDTYCHLLESSRSGWAASEADPPEAGHLQAEAGRWYFPKLFTNEREAWERLRSEFVEAFDLAARGDWRRIDELETLGRGPREAEVPARLFSRYGAARLLDRPPASFPALLDRPSEEVNASSVMALNRFLLAALRREPALEGWNTEELQRLLYNWRDPRGTKRVLKIAPGRRRFWTIACGRLHLRRLGRGGRSLTVRIEGSIPCPVRGGVSLQRPSCLSEEEGQRAVGPYRAGARRPCRRQPRH